MNTDLTENERNLIACLIHQLPLTGGSQALKSIMQKLGSTDTKSFYIVCPTSKNPTKGPSIVIEKRTKEN